MSCVRYMFSSMPRSSYIMFDGTGINVNELKTEIMKKEKLTVKHSALLVFNPQTNKEYTEDKALIAKNSSVVVKRIPPQSTNNSRTFELDKAGSSFGTIKDKESNASNMVKRCTGIPRSFLVEVDDESVKGAMLTSDGVYAMPMINKEAYAVTKKENYQFLSQEVSSCDESVPAELLCPICRELLTDAVIIPCCGYSYCDECIRTYLLESKDHVCPNCNEARVSPDTLCPNKALRDNVNNFWKSKPTQQNDSQWLSDQTAISPGCSAVTGSITDPLTNGIGQGHAPPQQPSKQYYVMSNSTDLRSQMILRPGGQVSSHRYRCRFSGRPNYNPNDHGGRGQRGRGPRRHFKSKFSGHPRNSNRKERRYNCYLSSNGQPGGSQASQVTCSIAVNKNHKYSQSTVLYYNENSPYTNDEHLSSLWLGPSNAR